MSYCGNTVASPDATLPACIAETAGVYSPAIVQKGVDNIPVPQRGLSKNLGLPMLPVTNYGFSFGEMTPVVGKKKHNNQKVSCNECRR